MRDIFIPSGTENDVHPPKPPKITDFTRISEDAFDKIIRNSPKNSCLLEPCPIFLIKECRDILLLSVTKLINFLLIEGHVPDGFKTALVTPVLKKSYLPADDLKTIALYLALVSFQNWLNMLWLSYC